eukprot:PLAT12370.1.p1 GENE.PLAT12370.1~~PLAT12370.1.p1  ORF type:complete len:199 (-),score=56.25 PLAT12370.1:21-554(-)
MFGGILRGDPGSLLLLLEDPGHPEWMDTLRQRFQAAFPEAASRVRFLPRMPQTDFILLCNLSTAMLDPFPMGGGVTSFEGFSVAAPIVTLPSRFMSLRFVRGMYEAMGIFDLIAKDESDYVRIALRLGRDARWNAAIRQRIRERKHLIYTSREVVFEWKRMLEDLRKEVHVRRLPVD